MLKIANREDGEPGICIRFNPIDKIVWSHEAAGQFTRAYINNSSRVGYCIVLVTSGHLLLYEVRETHF